MNTISKIPYRLRKQSNNNTLCYLFLSVNSSPCELLNHMQDALDVEFFIQNWMLFYLALMMVLL